MLLNNPYVPGIVYGFSIVALAAALGLIIVVFAFYGRTRDVYGDTAEKQRWTLLMGSWRDSLLITVLYTSDAFLYKFAELNGLAQAYFLTEVHIPFLLQPMLGLVLHSLIFMITIMRIIVISKWLAAQKARA
ncbi:hypothetical protein [uncultured Tateyamaria sp.]|uniref:hypothetical protein n=1 Tax=uncultured Tateyamaria sp. TaxID=455651 RepID=UPI002609C469|nr:hypothetical protein [uncultured Tateyamaria sp.]